ncbi:MAG: hypothetical protein RL404_1980 [Pseudomonadota bacterium]|jgi:truncated hemoglobin YjbI
MKQTLFDKYGGVPVVTDIVRDLHERLMRRPNIRRYFLDMPVPQLIEHHIKYVSLALGKPDENFSNNRLHAQHQQAGVTLASYELVLDLLLSVLRDNGIEESDIEKVAESMRALATHVVTRGITK